MSKVNLVQSKPGIGTQGATIVKLMTTQAGVTPGKNTTTTIVSPSSQSGQILTLPSAASPTTGKTVVQGQNIVIAKQQVIYLFILTLDSLYNNYLIFDFC